MSQGRSIARMLWHSDLDLEQFSQHPEHGGERPRGHGPESLSQTFVIDRPQLIQDDVAGLALKAARHAIGIPMPARREGGNDRRAEMMIELIR